MTLRAIGVERLVLAWGEPRPLGTVVHARLIDSAGAPLGPETPMLVPRDISDVRLDVSPGGLVTVTSATDPSADRAWVAVMDPTKGIRYRPLESTTSTDFVTSRTIHEVSDGVFEELRATLAGRGAGIRTILMRRSIVVECPQ